MIVGARSSLPARPLAVGPAILVGLLGFVLAAQWRAQLGVRDALAHRRETYGRIVEARVASTTALETRLAEMRAQADELAARGGERLTTLRALAARLGETSGTVAVSGPGVVVRLTDSPEAGGAGDSSFRVQDVDVQQVVNALWEAGAEAVAVNDQRVVSTTAIRNAGGAVLVNYRVLASPYHIEAIGDGDAVRVAFERSRIARQFRNWTQIYRLGFSIERSERLDLPGFSGSLRLRYASPRSAGG